MARLTINDFDPWFLSGKPVARLAGRDFDQSPAEYETWLHEMGRVCNLGVSTKIITDPPGVVVQTFLPIDDAPVLVDPLIKVSKGEHPWLFCLVSKCRNRVSVPGMTCKAHRD